MLSNPRKYTISEPAPASHNASSDDTAPERFSAASAVACMLQAIGSAIGLPRCPATSGLCFLLLHEIGYVTGKSGNGFASIAAIACALCGRIPGACAAKCACSRDRYRSTGSTSSSASRSTTGSDGSKVDRTASRSPAATSCPQLSHSPAPPSARHSGQLPDAKPSTRNSPERDEYGNFIVRSSSLPAEYSRPTKSTTHLVIRSS